MPANRWINLELYDSTGAPLSARSYELTLPDGSRRQGQLDLDGRLHESVPEGVESVSLDVAQRRFDLDLRGIPPIDTVEGVQERLNHLHYFVGRTDGDLGTFTRKAIKRFQRDQQLPETGEIDAATRQRLLEEHGS